MMISSAQCLAVCLATLLGDSFCNLIEHQPKSVE